MPEFIVEIGSRVERRSVDSKQVRIGREDVNDIVIDDSRISREHAIVEYHEGRWLLRDLGSANGTFQDGARTRRVVLERGSRFLVADVAAITFLGGDETDEADPARAARVGAPAASGPTGEAAGRAGAAPAVPGAPAAPRPEVSGYEILEELGAGPFSRAFLAHHRASGTAEVLRVPHRSDALLEGALLSWSRIDDPTLARLDPLRDDQGGLVMRERLASKGSLADRLTGTEKIEAPEALELAARLARGLSVLHRNGLAMGVLRPGRVRLYDDAEPRISGPALPRIDLSACPEDQVGGLRYLAPEHLRAEDPVAHPSETSDIYSLGALLYRLVAGAEVVDGKTLDGIRRSAEKGPLKTPDERRPGLPEGLSDLIMACLSADPTERPTGVDAVLTGLGAAAERLKGRARPAGQKLQAREKEAGERVASAPKRSTQFVVASWSVTIFLFALINFLVYWFLWRGRL